MPGNENRERIAIVGVGGIFPGAADVHAYWNNVSRGIDAGRHVPAGRWYLSPDAAYAPWPPQPDRVYSTWGCFIENFAFDPAGLNLERELLSRLDPMFHLGLHAARAAFRDARQLTGVDRARVGVILGNIALPTESTSALCRDVLGRTFIENLIDTAAQHSFDRADAHAVSSLKASLRKSDWHSLNRFAAGLPSSLIAQGLGLGGVAFTLDAACASSLYSLKFASEELLSCRADAMLAGGMSRPDCQYTQMGFAQLQALSKQGRCAPLSSAADGLVVGEGAGVFVLKRLSDAIAAGDHIYGVIAGIGLSNDRGANLLAPHSEGQLRAMRSAYAQAGWRPSDVDLIECHATGTPVGDAVEIASLHQLWQHEESRPRQCVIGGVKSNVGHLLTGAGAAGLMKVLFALKHQVLPPTANFREPAIPLAAADSPFRVLRESEPWPRRSRGGDPIPRRTTVNAFGFGGINAHVLIEEWNGSGHVASSPPSMGTSPVPVVIAGMSMQTAGDVPSNRERHWWGAEQSDWFQREIPHAGERASLPQSNVLNDIRIPFGKFRIPPLEMQDMLPQQQLMLLAAEAAMQDADPTASEPARRASRGGDRTGVFIGIELDPNTTNFHFRWSIEQDAPQWAQMLGLELNPEELADWIRELKDAAGPPLTANRVMGNLGGIVASRLAREFDVGGPSFTISAGGDSGRIALELATQFLQRGELDEALVGAVDLESDLRALLSESASSNPVQDSAIGILLRRAEDSVNALAYAQVTSIRQVDPQFTPSRATAALESIHRAAVAASQRLDGNRPWLRDRGNERWPAEWTCQGIGLCPVDSSAFRRHSRNLNTAIFVVHAATKDELTARLRDLEHFETSATIHTRAERWHRLVGTSRQSPCIAVLVVSSSEELDEAINRAVASIPDRNVFLSDPRADRGRVAFVFPGSGSVFPDMGRELLYAFPEVLQRQDQENQFLASQYAPDLIWQRDAFPALLTDHRQMIFSQVAMGTALCDLLGLFGVEPSASIGYSLGESAAFFGLRAWPERDVMFRRMHESTLFGRDLVAPFDAARSAWGIPSDQPVPWIAGVVDRSAEQVRSTLGRLRQAGTVNRVYLLIVNTPRQCVIGGDREQVDLLVSELSATFVPLAAPSTVHCDVLRHVEADYRNLHLMSTRVPAVATDGVSRSIDFYSGAWGARYDLNREAAAAAIVAQAVDTVDFPRVVEQAYADGVRTFIEVGPGSSCTRMIGEVLDDRPHFVQSALPVTSRPVEAFLSLLAGLIVHRVPVDLTCLYGTSQSKSRPASEREVVTRVGGLPFQIPAPAGGWRFRPIVKAIARPSFVPVVAATERPGDDLLIPVQEQTWMRQEAEIDFSSTATGDHPDLDNIWSQFQLMIDQRTEAHEAFLRFSARVEQLTAEHLALLAGRDRAAASCPAQPVPPHTAKTPAPPSAVPLPIPVEPPRALNRAQCMEFAVGKIGNVLGEKFAAIDAHPTRVRLPDEPLMLVDRILEIDGEPLSMTSGRVVTEHDIHPGAWYLDCGRIPTCIAVESGQADLFLSGWLGIDLQTHGKACYRLLDAVVTFHDALPQAGQVIHYDIRVLHFFRQGSTYLFRFEFDATVNGRPLLTMREGCAGFFTDEELAGGKGIIHTALDKRPRPGIRPDDWSDPVPLAVESYDDQQLLALRQGDLAGCFGPAFRSLPLRNPVTLPGLGGNGSRSRMWLIDRVLKLDPTAGKFGMGTILGELDIHPDDWFLTCHFCDDQVMPGTLMYECCLHTLRIFLLRMGWIGEAGSVVYEPIPEIRSRLKCRGQVLSSTRKVWYEVTLKEVGYRESAYCLADALMYADGKPIVEITDMSVRLTGLTKQAVDRLWQPTSSRARSTPILPRYDRRTPIFDTDRITAFAIGKPSEAFGDRYLPFDHERKIARLPGPPFQFLDRIVSIGNCQPWVLEPGGEIVAQYDVPPEAWYFASNRQPTMPFAVLLETALQPCGWLAAYLGSALTSDIDLSFRNLGGTAVQYRDVTPDSGTLTTTVKMTRVSNSAGMIIQHYDYDLRANGEPVYVGNTYFGFFSKSALANQIGIRDAKPYQPTSQELTQSQRGDYPVQAPFPDDQFRMIQSIESLSTTGGPYGHGSIVGTMPVDPSAWFFKAHFYQDPVVPGSLGLESFWQLLKVFAANRWKLGSNARFATPSMLAAAGTGSPPKHEWVYRGQVIPRDSLVTVSAVIRDVDDATRTLTGEGYLSVDGRVIYQMKNFILGCM